MLQFSLVASTPKYLVSHAFSDKQVGMQPEPFDWVLDQASLTNSGLQLLHDGKDYRMVKECIADHITGNEDVSDISTHVAKRLAELLGTPIQEEEDVNELLIDQFSAALREYDHAHELEVEGEKSPFISLKLSRWIRGVLLRRNGPLVEDLAAAAIVGMKEDYFTSTFLAASGGELEEAKYSGLFNFAEKRRWWRHELIAWGLTKFPNVDINSTQRMAEQFSACLAVPTESQSTCAVCGEKWPDTIARDADHSAETHLRQVHRSCSRSIKGHLPLPGFDELREFESE